MARISQWPSKMMIRCLPEAGMPMRPRIKTRTSPSPPSPPSQTAHRRANQPRAHHHTTKVFSMTQPMNKVGELFNTSSSTPLPLSPCQLCDRVEQPEPNVSALKMMISVALPMIVAPKTNVKLQVHHRSRQLQPQRRTSTRTSPWCPMTMAMSRWPRRPCGRLKRSRAKLTRRLVHRCTRKTVCGAGKNSRPCRTDQTRRAPIAFLVRSFVQNPACTPAANPALRLM